MASVDWTREALSNVELIRAYIRQFNPSAAQRTAARLIDAGNGLATFPHRGKLVASNERELVTVWPYIIRYYVVADAVLILYVRHGAQRR